jgi:hypothetical protein
MKTTLSRCLKRVPASFSSLVQRASIAPRRFQGRNMRWEGWSTILAIVLYLTFGLSFAGGQTPAEPPPMPDSVNQQLAYNVKAAFLYNFARYVEWPKEAFADKQAPFVIGIFGENPFGTVLGRIAKTKTVQDRRIEVKNIDSLDGLADCHILFITDSVAMEQQQRIIEKSQKKPILLVGEIPKFLDFGGSVNFFLDGNHVRFEINVDAVDHKKMQIDAKLLSVGKKVSLVRGSTDQTK